MAKKVQKPAAKAATATAETVVATPPEATPETTATAVEASAAPVENAKTAAPVEEAAVASKAKAVVKACIPLENHTCRIGNTSYTIKKDKEQKLPEDVAMILQRAGKVVVK